MVHKSTSPLLAGAIDRHRTGNYGEDEFRDAHYFKPSVYCGDCGCDIAAETRTKKIYIYGDSACCEECFKDRLFNENAEDYGMDLEVYNG